MTRWVVPGSRGLIVLSAVERAAASGRLESADDASDARFWAPDELAAAAGRTWRDLHEEPAAYATPARLLAGARTALAAPDGATVREEEG